MTARMRGNMTVNAGEFSTFLKELVNTGYIKTVSYTHLKSLFGILPKDEDLNEAKEERLVAK